MTRVSLNSPGLSPERFTQSATICLFRRDFFRSENRKNDARKYSDAMANRSNVSVLSYNQSIQNIKKTKDILQDLYCTFSLRLKEEQLIEGKALFIDGTKFEADANKYTFVWKKSVDRFYSNLKEKETQYYEDEIAPLINQAIERNQNQAFTKEEIEELHNLLQEELEKVEIEIDQANEQETLKKKKKKRRSLKKHRNRLKKDFIPREQKFEEYYSTFDGRNSFSKTDKAAN